MLLDAAQSQQAANDADQTIGSPNIPNNPVGPTVRTLYRLDENTNTYSWSTTERLKAHPFWWQDSTMRYKLPLAGPVAQENDGDQQTGRKQQHGAEARILHRAERPTARSPHGQYRHGEDTNADSGGRRSSTRRIPNDAHSTAD